MVKTPFISFSDGVSPWRGQHLGQARNVSYDQKWIRNMLKINS